MSIASFSIEELRVAVVGSKNLSEAIRSLGISVSGSTFNSVKSRIISNGISIDHWKRETKSTKLSNEEVFVKGPVRAQQTLKSKIKSLIKYECSICKNDGNHAGKPLILQLDHEDGDRQNNEISNLRWLCPNCHTQTPTFSRTKESSRVKKKELALLKLRADVELKCAHCDKIFSRKAETVRRLNREATFCSRPCNDSYNSGLRIVDPEIALSLHKNGSSMNSIARHFGVSFQAVKKVSVKYGWGC